MVLSSFSLAITEAELRTRCDCTVFGTDALKAVDAARQLGFIRTTKHTLSLQEIESLVGIDQYPIVLIDLRPVDGIRGTHALVVVGSTAFAVNVYDPAQGERFISGQAFATAWAIKHNLAIVVER